MAERTGRLASKEGVLRIALETGVALLAVQTLIGLAHDVGSTVQFAMWAGACVGLVHLLVTTPMARATAGRDARWRGHGVALVCAVAVLAAASWWRGGSIDAKALSIAALAFVVFRIVAGAAGIVLVALSEARNAAPIGMPLPSTCGGFGNGLHLHGEADRQDHSGVFAMTMGPSRPRALAIAISERDVGGEEMPEPGGRRDDSPGSDWLDMERLPADWLETSGALQESPFAAATRRAFDILAASGLVLLTLPLLLLTAIAIRIESPGPIFYRQERVGRNGRAFTLLKFRSMTVDAEAQGSPVWAVPQDPRVTRVGRLTRLTRIDEIPQVLNVLRGDMAFIGPRPERPVFVAQLERAIPHYADRAAVKPGITGWAQVRYRYGASVEDARMKLGYDLYYIRHRSLALDLRILAATVRVVMLQEGAR